MREAGVNGYASDICRDSGGYISYVITGDAVVGYCHKCSSNRAIRIITTAGRRAIVTLECVDCGSVTKMSSNRRGRTVKKTLDIEKGAWHERKKE